MLRCYYILRYDDLGKIMLQDLAHINIFITKKPKALTLGFNFTAIINTNHQRKKIHSKVETFLFYRRL